MTEGRGTVKTCTPPAGLVKATLCLALLSVMPGNSRAFDVDYEAGLAAQHSDNITLRDVDPISDTVVAPRLWFAAEQNGNSVKISAQGSVEHRHYVDGTFDDQTRGRFSGRLLWAVVPQRVDFIVQDYLSLQPVNQFEAFSPNNLQQVNVFTAGPTFYARFGPAMRGQLDLRYLDSYAEENEAFDTTQYSAAARLLRDINPTMTAGLVAESKDVRFDLPGRVSDYRQHEAYATFNVDRRRIDVRADLGYSRLEMDNLFLTGQRLSESYPLGRLTVDWMPSARSTFGLTVRHQLSDAAQLLLTAREIDFGLDRRNRAFNEFRNPDTIVEPNVFRERLVRGRYAYNGARLDVRVSPFERRMRFIEAGVQTQERRGVNLDIDYRVRPRITASLFATSQRREYLETGREDDDLVAGAGLTNRLTRKWTGRVDFEHRRRDSTEAGRDFKENAVMVSLSYRR